MVNAPTRNCFSVGTDVESLRSSKLTALALSENASNSSQTYHTEKVNKFGWFFDAYFVQYCFAHFNKQSLTVWWSLESFASSHYGINKGFGRTSAIGFTNTSFNCNAGSEFFKKLSDLDLSLCELVVPNTRCTSTVYAH